LDSDTRTKYIHRPSYSSLNSLHRFPIDAIKIDRSFVAACDDADNPKILRAMVRLAHSPGIGMTAEGIGSREQLAHLRELECEHGQGYYFAATTGGRGWGEIYSRRRRTRHRTVSVS